MRYYIIAGERSGDLHASNLVKAIRKHDPAATFRGLGGDYLKEQGVDLFAHYSDFAVMGFVEVLLNLIRISRYLKRCGQDIVAFKADAIILIDYAGFNRKMATFGKRNKIPVFYYISPKVWAWRQNRAWQLKANVDRMFVILPFEKDFYQTYGWEVDYVGNPVLDAVKDHKTDPAFHQKYKIDKRKTLVALLPGSRRQEVERIVPLLREIIARFPDVNFGVASVNNLDPILYNPLTEHPNVVIIQEDTYNLLQHCKAAIVTSGTATLETALFRVPQMVVYKAGAASYVLARMVVKVKFISLVNLIAGREVVKEFIQADAVPLKVGDELQAILSDNRYREKMLAGYDEIIKKLDTGSVSESAALKMVEHLKTISTSPTL